MNVGIIGYGSMGRMLLEKFSEANKDGKNKLFVSNRSKEKLADVPGQVTVCSSNNELAENADIIFLCVRPADIKLVLEEIKDTVKKQALIVSLNGNVPFSLLEKLTENKLAKVIPSVTAEVDRSQTLVCYNGSFGKEDKQALEGLLCSFGKCIELPENELGMGSELVSCMPGFIASIFDVICRSARRHTSIPESQIVRMVLETLGAASELMLKKDMSFEDVVKRVATKGGITEEGTKVVYESFPDTADRLFEKTLEKRRLTAENAEKAFKA